jgi:hypothetical protein
MSRAFFENHKAICGKLRQLLVRQRNLSRHGLALSQKLSGARHARRAPPFLRQRAQVRAQFREKAAQRAKSRVPVLSRQHDGASHGELLARILCRRLDGHRDGHARCEKLQKRRRARCRHGRCRGALLEC